MVILEKICRELEVSIGECWRTEEGAYYIINSDGTLSYKEKVDDYWIEEVEDWSDILTGKIKPVWKPYIGEIYFIPRISVKDGIKCEYAYWQGDAVDKWRYDNGIAFKHSRGAIECADRIIELLNKEG